MTSAQEKALWDFVRALAEWHSSEPGQSNYMNEFRAVRSRARALLSVLAEEAPPVKEPLQACTCGTRLGMHYMDCPEYKAAAPAPKQERGPTVEDILAGLLGDMEGTHPDKTITEGRVRVWQGRIRNAIKAVRQEWAASERVFEDSRAFSSRLRVTEAENASLRERVEKALARLRRHLAAIGEIPGCVCHACSARRILEGKGEGTEATK